MKICLQCPRNCKIDRNNSCGFCGASNEIRIAKVMLHHWEEPIISGNENQIGSGAIFFNHCNLKCVYCQNFEISHCDNGEIYSPEQLATLFKELEEKGALNINLVTPTHYSLQILTALKIYKPSIPIVWNTSGYENADIIEKLSGFVDIFLTDLKYFSNDLSFRYSLCNDYFEKTTQAIKAMRKICPKDEIVDGLMKKGLIVRHLVLPEQTRDSLKIFDWIKANLGEKTFISLMSQYTPCKQCKDFPELNRQIKPIEYKAVLRHIENLGFTNGFTQELSSSNNCFIPEFDKPKS